jgi:hypothetical protein
VQIEDQIGVLGGNRVNDLLHKRAVSGASVVLIGKEPKPSILRNREPDYVHMPVMDGLIDGVQNVPFAIRAELESRAIHSAQEHPMTLTVDDVQSVHVELRRLGGGGQLSHRKKG